MERPTTGLMPNKSHPLPAFPAFLLSILLPSIISSSAFGGGFDLSVDGERELHVQVQALPETGDDQRILLIWLEEVDEPRPLFEALLQGLRREGMAVWRINPFRSYFLERTPGNRNRLDGRGVAALIEHAVTTTDRRIAVVAAEHLSLAALRGVRRWQQSTRAHERLAGVILHYPNLYDTAPIAGETPRLLPLARAVNAPVYVFQPELGTHGRRIKDLMQALWAGGSPAVLRWVSGVRDWWFMHDEPRRDPMDEAQAAALPVRMRKAVEWMDAQPVPKQAPALRNDERRPRVRGLVERKPMEAPDFLLQAARGGEHRLSDTHGSVVLVNFWATWCPPCVEEIPSMNRLAERYADRDFRIVSINFMESSETILAFMEQVDVDFPVLLDPQGATSHDWNVFAFPTSFLLDRNGLIRYSVNSAIDWHGEEVVGVIDALVSGV